jgi:hypothetical protein
MKKIRDVEYQHFGKQIETRYIDRIHGYAVFATEDIVAGAVLCEMPGKFGMQFAHSNRYVVDVPLLEGPTKYEVTAVKVGKKKKINAAILGKADYHNASYCGAVINDLDYKFVKSDKQYHYVGEHSNVLMIIRPDKYVPQSNINENGLRKSKIIDARILIQAYKDIPGGKEISLSYGSQYWSCLNRDTSPTYKEEQTNFIVKVDFRGYVCSHTGRPRIFTFKGPRMSAMEDLIYKSLLDLATIDCPLSSSEGQEFFKLGEIRDDTIILYISAPDVVANSENIIYTEMKGCFGAAGNDQ